MVRLDHESVLVSDGVVEISREVAFAGVGKHDDNQFIGVVARVFSGGRERCTRRDTDQQSVRPAQFPGRGFGVGRLDGADLIDEVSPEDIRDEAGADPLDLVTLGTAFREGRRRGGLDRDRRDLVFSLRFFHEL